MNGQSSGTDAQGRSLNWSQTTHKVHPPAERLPKTRLTLGSPSQQSIPFHSSTNDLDLSKVRAFSACKACRTKKIKCLPTLATSADPSQPPGTCQQCIQSGSECTYPPTRDRAAYSRQYVQNLEARVQALENLNTRIVPMLELFERSGLPPSTPHDVLMDPSHGPYRRGSTHDIRLSSSRDRSLDDDEVEDEDAANDGPARDDEGQMAQDEHGNYRWIGSSNTLSLLDSFGQRNSTGPEPTSSRTPAQSAAPSPANGGSSNPYFGPVAGSGVIKALPGFEEVNYPSRQAAEAMVNAFFAEVHLCLPVLIERDFRETYTGLMDRKARGQPEGVSAGFISVVFAIFALGERVIVTTGAWERERSKLLSSTQDTRMIESAILPGEAEAGVIWYERAQILHYTSLKDVNIHQVQCLTLLAAFQAGVNAMPMSWLLAGQALRVAQDLGLHRSPFRMTLSLAEKELRSRCWWAIYGLERLVSISLGRPVGIDDSEIDVAYPAAVDEALLRTADSHTPHEDLSDEAPESTMSGFVALTKLCRIAGRVAHVFYRPSKGRSIFDPSWAAAQQVTIDKLDKLLRDWLKMEVPSKYKDPSSVRSVQLVSAVLSNAYFAVMITLHRNFLPANPDYPRPKPPPSSQSLARCVDAARSVIHIAAQSRILLPPSHHIAVYCQYLWTSAVVLLLCEVQAKDQVVIDTVGSHVESCRLSLQALEPVWPGSRKLKELLNDVESRTKEVLVATRPKRLKKRKSSPHEPAALTAQMAPPSHVPPPRADTWQGLPNGPDPQTKRMRMEPNRYETSDTRSSRNNLSTMSTYSLLNPESDSKIAQDELSYAALPPFNLSPTFDMQFDVGGVNFDGLELLQSFATVDAASNLWAVSDGTAHYAGLSNSSSADGFPQLFPLSGQGTPNSGQEISPSSWPPAMGTTSHLTSNQGSASGDLSQSIEGAEFWSQVGGSSFDWQADPNVPFSF